MFNIICTIAVVVKIGGINVENQVAVEGTLLSEGTKLYLVDFSEGVKKHQIAGKPYDYSKVLVKKDECVRSK